jgi:hypothetical protein
MAHIMEKIKFTEDREVEAQGKIVKVFKAGEIYELRADSARHWIRRNAAVRVFDDPPLNALVIEEVEEGEEAPAPKRGRRGRPARAARKDAAVEEPEAAEETPDEDPEAEE